jgi:hypothetical protein
MRIITKVKFRKDFLKPQPSFNDEKIEEKFLYLPLTIKTYTTIEGVTRLKVETRWLEKVKIKYKYTHNYPYSGDIFPLTWKPIEFIK